MSESVTLRVRKFMTNRLLSRKQMVVDVHHPGRANVSKADLREQIKKQYKVKDENTIVLFGFRTQYGGGKSTGFCLIYDALSDVMAVEPGYRLCRLGLKERVERSRKMIKELKNKKKKVRGTKKASVGSGKKK